MTPNNRSRVNFKKYISENKLERAGNRNVFFIGDSKIIFAESGGNFVRQFYEDCEGVLLNGELLLKDDFEFQSVSRISPKGLKAYNAVLKYKGVKNA